MRRFIVRTVAMLLAGPGLILTAAIPLTAADIFFELERKDLQFDEPVWPRHERIWAERQQLQQLIPYAVLDGDGEIYLGAEIGELQTAPFVARGPGFPEQPDQNAVAIRAPQGQPVAGTLYVPNADATALTPVKFRAIDAESAESARANFYRAKSQYYRWLMARRLPGAAWFRYQARQAEAELTGKESEPEIAARQPGQFNRPGGRSQLEETLGLFSGGRAVSENLQLDRLLPAAAAGEATVDISSLEGISIPEINWDELTADIAPQIDPLARYIPADQHVLFFPTFQAMVRTMDEAAQWGAPLLFLIEQRAEDAETREKYQRQLCLSIDAVSRLVGQQVIGSVAFTGSDPYLRTGTDVAVLFEAPSPDVLAKLIGTKQRAAVRAHSECREVAGKTGGLEYTGVVTPDRHICSYMAMLGDSVVVTNSLAQLRRVGQAGAEQTDSIAELPEYRFFRDRYNRTDPEETALLIVTDATIRRWCGPKWRIAASRRTRAAAIMAAYQAEHLESLVAGNVAPRQLETELSVSGLGRLQVTSGGVSSSAYGTLEFLTPISELELGRVTPREAELYRGWRDGYQRYWRQFFDPIAARFSIRDDRISADVTVMPLIEQSDYNEFIQIASGAEIAPGAGDPHKEALAHLAVAVNLESPMLRRASNFLQNMMQQANVSPLSWLGGSVAVYIDDDPIWKQLAEADDQQDFLLREMDRLPVALRAEVSDGLKLTLFLTGLRGLIEQTAPGMLTWETLKHNDQPYVKVTPTDRLRDEIGGDVSDDAAIYYVATPRSLVVTLNEPLLWRSIDREAARVEGEKQGRLQPDDTRPWLGRSVGLQLDGKVLSFFDEVFGDDYQALMRSRAWANIPILNEWKRRFPDRDPVALHRQYWQTTLRSPGGGYIWNEEHHTMQSTVFGHPAEPKTGPKAPTPLAAIRFADFGLTFEHGGLRAKAVLERERLEKTSAEE